MLLLLLACAAPDTPGAAPDSLAPSDSADPCAGAPVVDWNSFGDAFLGHACAGCHAGTTPNRNGAPEEVRFDTVDLAWEWAPRILARATGQAPSMPPRGGVADDDRQKLAWWLGCGVPGR